MSECLNGIYFDNRRKNLNLQKPVDNDNVSYRIVDLMTMLHQPQVIDGTDMIRVRGGDGSLGLVIDTIGRRQQNPVIVYEGGGSACTTLRGLRTLPSETVPEHLQEVFPPDQYESRLYRGLAMTTEHGEEWAAYLAGFSHLTVTTTRYKEKMADLPIPLAMIYSLAGAGTIFSFPSRLRPNVTYKKDGQVASLDEHLAAADVISIPALGTFSFAQEHPRVDSVRLLTIEADNEIALARTYMQAIALGSKNPDQAIKQGLVTSRDVDEVTVYPGAATGRPNSCIDGEQRSFSSAYPLTVRRAPPVTIVLPKSLLGK